ncbi:MAG: MmgE/PrpD family protein [Anaerolineae bacterium]
MNGTDHALQFILHTTWADLPATVQHQAKRCLLDSLGALLAGTVTPVVHLMADFAAEQYRGDEATILGDGRRVSQVGAALANGFAANALDIDDGYRPIKGHPGVCVLPALLAASEWRGSVSGQEWRRALCDGGRIEGTLAKGQLQQVDPQRAEQIERFSQEDSHLNFTPPEPGPIKAGQPGGSSRKIRVSFYATC